VLYLFSTFIHQNNIQTIDKDTLVKFVRTYIEIDPDFIYKADEVADSFDSNEAQGICRGNKLICTSQELLNRLLYQLRLLIERDRTNVFTFFEKKSMDSYYSSESDFTKYSNENIIYYTPDMPIRLSKLLESSTEGYKLFTSPAQNIDTPYFIKHPELTLNKISLSQNVVDADKALSTCVVWVDDGYNSASNDIVIRKNISYYLYVLINGTYKIFQVGRGVVHDDFVVVFHSELFSPLMIL
jgi:hypothetical protein